MIVDSQANSPDLSRAQFDVCIAGAGIAGITLAVKLAGLGRRVLLIEAGDLQVSEGSQAFYRGENSGTENLPLHQTRLRALGGSSNHWGGWCRPFDAHDFERRYFAPDGSWPITAADLRPYIEEAATILSVNRYEGADLDLEGANRRLRTARMYFSAPPARIGERYLDTLKAADNIVLLINAAVVGVEFDGSGLIRSLKIHDPNSESPISGRAKLFVLALGTVENIRALLIFNRAYGNTLGNRSGLVGKYYLQHLHQTLGEFVLFDDRTPARPPADNGAIRAFFLATGTLLAETQTGAFRLYSTGIDCSALRDEFHRVTGAACSAVQAGAAALITAEHTPNPDSRITLIAPTDEIGQPRVRLHWRISNNDLRTMRTAAYEFGRYLIQAGLGRLKVNPVILEGTEPLLGWTSLPSAAGAAGHQMGGARMGRSPADGVVDKDCCVWGTQNLFVAGAAVFRTCSQVTPTLTIVQLCLRLADHLHRVLLER